jgi:hypothetical protein
MSGVPIRTLQYYFNGPPTQGIVIKQRGNNGVQSCTAPAPNQQYPTDQTGNVANARVSFMNAQKNVYSANSLAPSTSKVASNTNYTTSMFHSHYQRRVLAGKPIPVPVSGDQYINMIKYNAIGKSAYKVGLAQDAPYQTKNNDNTIRNIRRQRCRSGGCVAPKKKGAIENPFQSGGSSILSSLGNRQIYAS